MIQPPDPTRTLVLRGQQLVPQEAELVRVHPIWASPPEVGRLVMLGDANPEAAAALRVIRHRLERRRQDGMWTFGVTSAKQNEGKTTFATQLALVLSEAQRARVLLVEAGFNRPALARLLGFRVPSGLGFSVQIARRMRGEGEPWSVLALGPTLHVLAENEAEPGYPATLHATAFRQAIERVGRGYDWVVVDAPSVLGTGDANVVEEVVDGMILVARSTSSRASELRAALKQLGGRKSVGLVLWDVNGTGAPSAS